MTTVFLIILLIHLLGYPIIGIKLTRSILKKEKSKIKKFTISFLMLMVFSGFVFEKLPGSELFWWPIDAIDSKIYSKNLTGKSFILPKPIYEWNSKRSFNGDGSSITIYKLKENINDYFLIPDSLFFENYPKKGIREDWEIMNWKNTPIRSEHMDAFYFASFVESSSNYNLEQLLREKGNYYSFRYYLHSFSSGDEHYGDIDFYIINPKKRILIAINHNT